MYVAQGVKLYVAVVNLHEAVGFARVIDVVRAVAPATPVQTPPVIYGADAKHATIRPAIRFRIGDSLARIVGDFFAAREANRGKASFAVDTRFSDGQAGCESHFKSGVWSLRVWSQKKGNAFGLGLQTPDSRLLRAISDERCGRLNPSGCVFARGGRADP
ncbi:MAG: hypothetical protein QOH63_463 [Acidobacteriota bacterium]|nr:hypothetical protein [Acidobacteriota bacterium]